MNRQEYRDCRKLIKDNGRYALRWLTPEQSNTFEELLYVQDSTDRLAERASIVSWCNRENVSYNFRHLR